jgi:adenylosuccinate lyase
VHLTLLEGYGDEVVAAVFSESAAVERWLAFERALAAAQAELGVIPGQAAAAIAAEAAADKVDLAALRERTRVVGYPILPLLEQIGAGCSSPVARYVHWGATTQDVVDTGLAVAMRDVLVRAEELASTLGDALASLADEHRLTVMPGRTHARPAVPISFGGKVAVWLDELARTSSGCARHVAARPSSSCSARPARRRRRASTAPRSAGGSRRAWDSR